MRAATICLFLPSLDGGGAERVFVQLANEFVQLGADVRLLLAAARGPYLSEVCGQVRVEELGGAGVLRSLPLLVKQLKADPPDVLLSALDHSNIVAILACSMARLGIRCVISMRSVPSVVYREEGFLRKWLLPPIMRRSYPRADRVVANSRAVARDLIENFRVPPEKVEVIYNPLNLDLIEQLSREELVDDSGAAASLPLILGVGSLTALKDFPTLIRAFSIVRSNRECRLAILGEGPNLRELQDLAVELHVQKDVLLPGFVNNPFAWMRRAKVLVTSSMTEGCPNALMQALACGTAVVSTDCAGGCSEILEGGRWGRMVPVGDFQAMATAILATMDCERPVDVRKRASDFAIRAIARKYLQVMLPHPAQPSVEP